MRFLLHWLRISSKNQITEIEFWRLLTLNIYLIGDLKIVGNAIKYFKYSPNWRQVDHFALQD